MIKNQIERLLKFSTNMEAEINSAENQFLAEQKTSNLDNQI